MDVFIPLFMAAAVGFGHAFEADHLVAVSSIVTRRNDLMLAVKDGVFWGLGHTSTILLAGFIFILGRVALHEHAFRYLEAAVGGMLVVLGVLRLRRRDEHPHSHTHSEAESHPHKLAYGVGLIHGLAGSGALILSVLTQLKDSLNGLLYLLVFGLGSVVGMMVAAGIFSVPFSLRVVGNQRVRNMLTWISSGLCIGLGLLVLYQNLVGV